STVVAQRSDADLRVIGDRIIDDKIFGLNDEGNLHNEGDKHDGDASGQIEGTAKTIGQGSLGSAVVDDGSDSDKLVSGVSELLPMALTPSPQYTPKQKHIALWCSKIPSHSVSAEAAACKKAKMPIGTYVAQPRKRATSIFRFKAGDVIGNRTEEEEDMEGAAWDSMVQAGRRSRGLGGGQMEGSAAYFDERERMLRITAEKHLRPGEVKQREREMNHAGLETLDNLMLEAANALPQDILAGYDQRLQDGAALLEDMWTGNASAESKLLRTIIRGAQSQTLKDLKQLDRDLELSEKFAYGSRKGKAKKRLPPPDSLVASSGRAAVLSELAALKDDFKVGDFMFKEAISNKMRSDSEILRAQAAKDLAAAEEMDKEAQRDQYRSMVHSLNMEYAGSHNASHSPPPQDLVSREWVKNLGGRYASDDLAESFKDRTPPLQHLDPQIEAMIKADGHKNWMEAQTIWSTDKPKELKAKPPQSPPSTPSSRRSPPLRVSSTPPNSQKQNKQSGMWAGGSAGLGTFWKASTFINQTNTQSDADGAAIFQDPSLLSSLVKRVKKAKTSEKNLDMADASIFAGVLQNRFEEESRRQQRENYIETVQSEFEAEMGSQGGQSRSTQTSSHMLRGSQRIEHR
ncbi:hypothetical protein CYMTET_42154, partial [Cymbomonas tetramitiformis]